MSHIGIWRWNNIKATTSLDPFNIICLIIEYGLHNLQYSTIFTISYSGRTDDSWQANHWLWLLSVYFYGRLLHIGESYWLVNDIDCEADIYCTYRLHILTNVPNAYVVESSVVCCIFSQNNSLSLFLFEILFRFNGKMYPFPPEWKNKYLLEKSLIAYKKIKRANKYY